MRKKIKNKIYGIMNMRTISGTRYICIPILIILGLSIVANADNVQVYGQVAEGANPYTWDGKTFSALYYDIDNNIVSENLGIASAINDRSIAPYTLTYTTYKIPMMYQSIKNGHDFPYGDGTYYVTNILGRPYVAINGKTDKLSKLLIEQDTSDKKVLEIGESWDIGNIGNGWRLTIRGIDAGVEPRQTWLTLSNNGRILDDKIVKVNDMYIYRGNIAEEADIPLFVTYIDSIFDGYIHDAVQLKYTWAISNSAIDINVGDQQENMQVTTVNDDYIQFANIGPIKLTKGDIVAISKNLKFRVANSDTLRYRPMVERYVPRFGDVTCDDKITADDALKVLKKALGEQVDLECSPIDEFLYR